MNKAATVGGTFSVLRQLLVLSVVSLFLFSSTGVFATSSGGGEDDDEDSVISDLEDRLNGGGGFDFGSLGLGDKDNIACRWPKPNGEDHKCREVDCDLNTVKALDFDVGTGGVNAPVIQVGEFKKRVKEYFEYKPPADNRSAYLNKSYHDYDVNMRAERTRAPTSKMDGGRNFDNTVANESKRQDNRWRDMCLIGNNNLDIDAAYRTLEGTEEPLSGIVGSSPIYDKSSSQLNCLPNKNTERVSPLTFDNGWRYRDMCPGSQQLRRVSRDQQETALDIFRGSYGCLTPLPKCDLKDDWKFDEIDWVNQEHGSYAGKFATSIANTLGAVIGVAEVGIATKLKDILTPTQYGKITLLLAPQASPAAECKPAFWVRLMLDSCANQYILNKGMNPNYVFNKDKQAVGDSARFCQPFKVKPLSFFEQEEYNVSEYILRSYKGLLTKKYMPWVEYDRHEGDFNDEAEQFRDDNWPERKIGWGPGALTESGLGLTATIAAGVGHGMSPAIPLNPVVKKINDYAAHPVERIVDPLHPYSPRYDIATTIEGKYLLDREIFGDATESPKPRITWALVPLNAEGLKKYYCVPKKNDVGKGYYQYGCTIYCSSVKVDLLRFRYKDYRLCMGCQIDANEKAFWEEYEINRKHYRQKYCWGLTRDSDCDYGDDICSACTRAIASGAVCVATGNCDKFLKDFEGCLKCGEGSKAEALERARDSSNVKEEPEWGPTAVGRENWPVCSTQFDHKGDPELCEKAKEEYSCDNQGSLATDDPNIAEDSKEAAKACIKKDIGDICGAAAKPIYSVNFLKIRTRKGDFKTDDKKPNPTVGNPMAPVAMPTNDFDERVEEYRRDYADEDPAKGYGFREYFGNHRPYMRWWDTGKEAFQVGGKPDYWCDWGANDTITGVGRDYNSIHGRKAQLCRYGGGDSIGNSCFTMQDWKDGTDVPHDRKFPSLAGSEWAELKMYQANCFRNRGMNCLCQYEKVFKGHRGEDKALAMMGAELKPKSTVLAETSRNKARMGITEIEWPLSWRGYVSTPAGRDTNITSPAISKNQQFPHLFGDPKDGSMIDGGLDEARIGDIVIWPAGSGALPHVAIVTQTNNLSDYGTIANVPNKSRWVRVTDANNGKYPDACGNTSYLGHGAVRTLYADKGELPDPVKRLIEEQVTSTFYCEDPELGDCVERRWEDIQIYRPSADDVREVE